MVSIWFIMSIPYTTSQTDLDLENHPSFVEHIPVGGSNPSEKYEFVNGKDGIPYMKWKIKAMMFQTTNQI